MDQLPVASEFIQLYELAEVTAHKNAYAPYSKFRVGAAVQGRYDRYLGVNVESASYGLSLCAERAALAAACTAGERQEDMRVIAIACIDADPDSAIESYVPCGACRQWIQDLAPNAKIIVKRGAEIFDIGELLPFGFRLRKSKERLD